MAHFDASVPSGESPVNGRAGLVSFCLQGRDLCHVEPTTVLGSVVKLQTPGDAPGFCGREGLVERNAPLLLLPRLETVFFNRLRPGL